MKDRIKKLLKKQQQKTKRWAKGKVEFPKYELTKEHQEEERMRGIFLESLKQFAENYY